MRIAIAIHERQPNHAHIETFHPEQGALSARRCARPLGSGCNPGRRHHRTRQRRTPGDGGRRTQTQLVLDASERLAKASVNAVASELGVSERHLRRVFRETIGVGPKTFAKVTRFRRAVRAAREENHASWATIAAAVGYYDQAHLITEFRAIAGVTPRALLGELRTAQPIV